MKDRAELERLSKEELVEAYLTLQSRFGRPAKTSRTSSLPPSRDRKENREASKPGGAKPGHAAHFRPLEAEADRIVDHRPEVCASCGAALPSDAAAEEVSGHDLIELAPVRPVVERHRRLACACPSCGARTKASLPEAAKGSPFGPSISAAAFYLKHIQHLSYERLEAAFHDLFGLKISQGGLGKLLARGAKVFEAAKAGLLTRLRRAKAVASDETGVRIEGVNAHQWVFRAEDVVFHEMAFSRGAQVVRDVMEGHRPAYWLSDRYSAQQGHGLNHQTCLAHLARDAAWVMEAGDERIGLGLKLWIGEAFALARDRDGLAASTVERKRRDLDQRMNALLAETTDDDETRKVLDKIRRARDQLLTFAEAPPGLLEPDNSGCERALRPSVIHRKVIGGFRSEWGAKADAALRSVVDTDRLAAISPFQSIRRTLSA